MNANRALFRAFRRTNTAQLTSTRRPAHLQYQFEPSPSIRTMSSSSSPPRPAQQDPSNTQSQDPPKNQDSTQNTSQSPLPLPLPPSPDSNSNTPTLDVSQNQTLKLDHLGPLVVNKDGSLSRIANWDKMAEIERQNTLRVLGKRNQSRLEALRAKESEDGNSNEQEGK